MSKTPDYETPLDDMSDQDLIENALAIHKSAVFEMDRDELLSENVRLGANVKGHVERTWNWLLITVDSGIPDVMGQYSQHSNAIRAWNQLIEGNGHDVHLCDVNGINHTDAFDKGYFCYHKTEYRVHSVALEGFGGF